VTAYRLVAQPRADLEVVAAYQWYESERVGLGMEFLDQLSAAYDRIAEDPLRYQDLESGIRRVLLRRFPYAVYFAIESDLVVVLAVLHVSRDPAEWQRRRGI
jgi:plasmid stabilization system protein ParE